MIKFWLHLDSPSHLFIYYLLKWIEPLCVLLLCNLNGLNSCMWLLCSFIIGEGLINCLIVYVKTKQCYKTFTLTLLINWIATGESLTSSNLYGWNFLYSESEVIRVWILKQLRNLVAFVIGHNLYVVYIWHKDCA